MVNNSNALEERFQITPQPILLTLVLLGVLLFIFGELFSFPLYILEYTLFSLYALTILTWFAWRYYPPLGQWMMIPIMLNAVYLASLWFGTPGLLVFITIPVALTVPLIRFRAAILTAAVETILLFALPLADIGTAERIPAIVAIWMMLGVVYLVYQPIQQLRNWLSEYFAKEQAQIEANRDQRLAHAQMIKELAQANLHLNQLNLLTQNLRQMAEEARQAKEQFVANVSHELRTPLNMITGFSETILQTPELYGNQIPPMLLADLAVIHRNAEHLSSLIDDVLDLSLIDAEQMALTKEPTQFSALIDDVLVAVRPLFESKGLYLRSDVQSGIPPILCDRTRMSEVLMNLLSNAGRFTEQGGVLVKVRQLDEWLNVTVQDTGFGVAAKDLDKLFEPFQQIDGSIRRRFGGTGLGLSISKRFIELHDGKIWVSSQENVGTTITFQLPISPSLSYLEESDFNFNVPPEWEFLHGKRPLKTLQSTARPRYVVAEADRTLSRLLSRYQDDVDVVTADNLAEAITAVHETPTHALLINQPKTTHSTTQLNANLLPVGMPALICSIPNIMSKTSALGETRRLIKPISQQRLLATIDQLGVLSGTVLIVDDEPDALQLYGRILASSKRKYRILLARNGREALNILADQTVQLILLDLIMPHMNGFQFLEETTRDPRLKEIPTIILSALDPTSQPIGCESVAITQNGGLSTKELLSMIEMITRSFSAAGQNIDSAYSKASFDQPASE